VIGNRRPSPAAQLPRWSRERLEADRRQAWRFQVAMVVLLVAVIIGIFLLVRARGNRHLGSAPPVTVTGLRQDRRLPFIPLTSESGAPTSLLAYRGKVVLLAPVLSECTGTCPYTIGAFSQIQHYLTQAGLGSRVAIVQVSLDPSADTPARLRSFSQLTGISWPLLTGSPANVYRLWRFLGISHERVAPGATTRNWQTGQPATYAVRHNDALYFLDPKSRVRIATFGPGLGTLSADLHHLLALEGVPHQHRPSKGWTVRQALGNIEVLLDQRIPLRH
jgi:cytochrome oxidase Cu insertion factor (SCO1/SenC/PrrC family)